MIILITLAGEFFTCHSSSFIFQSTLKLGDNVVDNFSLAFQLTEATSASANHHLACWTLSKHLSEEDCPGQEKITQKCHLADQNLQRVRL
jgi:hypothetical protein